MLQCPSAEVRSAFGKILVYLAHMSLTDEPCHLPASDSSIVLASEATLADRIFQVVLNLWDKEVADYGRHLSQYFNLFLVYASLGLNEKAHLIKLDVLSTFMGAVLDGSRAQPIKYQYPEFYQVKKLAPILNQTVDRK